MVWASLAAWDELLGAFLQKEDQHKLEWSIGAVLAGGPNKILVVTGSSATGKSTILSLADEIFKNCREECSLKTRMLHEGHKGFGFDHDAFTFAASLEPLRARTIEGSDPVIEIHTTGDTFSISKFHLLVGMIVHETNIVALRCLNTYRKLGENHYDTVQENNNR